MYPVQQNEARHMCRCCAVITTELRSISDQMDDDSRTILEVLQFVTNIQVKENDDLPNEICADCIKQLQIANKLKIICLKSEKLFRLAKSTNVTTIEDHEFFCFKCNIQFNKDEDYLQHDDCHRNPYQCSICQSRFQSMDELENHIDSHIMNFPNKYECDNCGMNYSAAQKTDFDIHVKLCRDDKTALVPEIKMAVDSFQTLHYSDIESTTDCSDRQQELSSDEDISLDQIVKSRDLDNSRDYSCKKVQNGFKPKRDYKKRMKEKHSTNAEYDKNTILSEKDNVQNTDDYIEDDIRSLPIDVKTEIIVEDGNNFNNIDSVPYACPMCERKFSKKESCEAHIKKHGDIEKQCHVCSICNRKYKYKAHLEKHILTVHSSEGELNCDYCPNTFATKAALDVHVNSHKEQKKHQCQFCNKGFNMLSTLQDHLRVHTGEKPYLCATCGKVFTQSTNLKEHMRRHAGFKPFSCSDCDQRFVTKGELVTHKRKHSGAHPFFCPVCWATFTTSSSMVKHRRIHTGERPYSCEVCPKKFMTLDTLKNHNRTHTGEKPFRCSHCDKEFAQKSDLASHNRIHTGELPYVCSTCGQAFRQSSTLKTHIRQHTEREDMNAPLSLQVQRAPIAAFPGDNASMISSCGGVTSIVTDQSEHTA